MARPEASDYFQGMSYHCRTSDGFLEHTDSIRGEAGFNSCSLPELSAEATEYKEGNMLYTQKQPGAPTVGQVSLQRGVTKTDTKFFDWMMRTVNGGEYRTTLTIYHFHRDQKTNGVGDLSKAKKMICHEAWPSRCKPDGDLEATSSDVSMAELDVEIEWFEIIAGS